MIGTVVDDYKILEKIGAGEMGDVYKARDSKLERDVAIKVLRPKLDLFIVTEKFLVQLGADPSLAKRFDTEAAVLAKLNHSNIVTFYKGFREDSQFYLVLEFIQGETLGKLSKRCGAIPWQTAVPLTCQALNGLEYAHNLKVIHLDIRPANLMLNQASILKIMDFGIAPILGERYLTLSRRLIGTRRYRSPEQLQGQETDIRSDLYAIGAVLYQLLTGHVPFENHSDNELLKLPVTENPISPGVFVPELPQALEAAVMRALARAPEERFQNAAAFRTELEIISKTAAAGREIGKGPPSWSETAPGGAPIPSVQAVSVAAASAATEPPAQPHLASYWSYFKRYRTPIVSCILIGIATLLIRITYKPSPPPTVVTQPDQIQQADKGQEQRPESSSSKPTVEQLPAAAPSVVEPQLTVEQVPVAERLPITEPPRVVEPPPEPVPVTPVPSPPEQPTPIAKAEPPPVAPPKSQPEERQSVRLKKTVPVVPPKPQPGKKPALRSKAPAPAVPTKTQPAKEPVVQSKGPAPTVSEKTQPQEKKKRHTGSSARGISSRGWKIID